MDRFDRNIRQLEERGIDVEKYFVKKIIEECRELIEVGEEYLQLVEDGVEDRRKTTTFDNLQSESTDVTAVITYLIEYRVLDVDAMEEILIHKQDRAYKRINEGG